MMAEILAGVDVADMNLHGRDFHRHQRVMQRDPRTAWTFAVRDYAPTTLLLANIGVMQAAEQPTAALPPIRRSMRH